MEADEHQRRVIESRARTIRLVAPAGSGKTGTIVGRVLRRIQEGVPAERILLLTFDRSAAASVAARLARAAAGGPAPRVSTLNAFGYRLLRERVPAEHAPVAPAETCLELAAEGIEALARASPARRAALPEWIDAGAALGLHALLKNALLDPHELDPDRLTRLLLSSRPAAAYLPLDRGRGTVEAAIEAIAWLYRAYEEGMRRIGRLDFDDQKLRACAALASSPRLAREVAGAYDEVIVDEFQDVNRLDFELVRAIARRARLVVAGDDDQAIYGFRGCTSEFIVDLERRLDRAVASHELAINYRSPPEVLAHAERLIRRNPGRIPKRPVASRTDAAEIVRLVHPDGESEAAAVAEWVRRAVESAGGRWGEVAILVRLHAQAPPFREALRARGVPVRVEVPAVPGDAPEDRESTDGEGRDAVEIRTYFKAKGSQWPTVVLVGCHEGVIPHERSLVEDERRLFYVGITRAGKRLVVSSVAPGSGRVRPSRFLAEAGLDGE
ncbi:MAG TPA: ATP-dependent helicase [Gemmatimonadota bacterium]|nr:ATP-dependent helicase [Gemmatimonadota bacterium]